MLGLAKAFRENLFAAYAVEHRQNQRIFANKARGGFHRAAQAALFGRKDHQIDGFRFFGRHVSKRHGRPIAGNALFLIFFRTGLIRKNTHIRAVCHQPLAKQYAERAKADHSNRPHFSFSFV